VGFRFRRSVKLLPGVRLNLSKSGASVSLGPRGLHYTIGPNGTRFTAGIPGSGLSWTQYTPHGRNSSGDTSQRISPAPHLSPSPRIPTPAFGPVGSQPTLVSFESAAGTEINALSTSQLAIVLNEAHRRFRLAPLMLIGSLGLFLISSIVGDQVLVGLSALFATVHVPISIFLDRYRRSVKVGIKLNPIAQTITAVLSESFSDLKSCNVIWDVQAEGHTSDWKRHAGATTLSQRHVIRPQFDRPGCIRGNVTFPTIKLGRAQLFFLPDAVLVVSKRSVAALHYRDLYFSEGTTRFIEEGCVPSDTTIVDHTWRFVNKTGGPDRRFNSNRQLPVCQYGEMDFSSSGGLNGKIQFSHVAAGQKFAKALKILIAHAAASSELNPIAFYRVANKWPTIAFLSSALVIGAVLTSADLLAIPEITPTAKNISTETKQGGATTKQQTKDATTKLRPMESNKGATKPPMEILPALTGPSSTLMPPTTHGSISPPRSSQPVPSRL
jgi:hypothetical protein